MEQDFHYYAIYRLAALAGFSKSDAATISYASQYVDDATESEPIRPFEDQYFDTARTAHYNLEGFSWNVQKKIYLPFHFLPAAIRWSSPGTFTYITSPASGEPSELATLLVQDALSEKDQRMRLIRLGMALHTVADTFSHFGFSGRDHAENNVGSIWHRNGQEWEKQFFHSCADVFVPRIGHMEAFKFPDLPWLVWRYENKDGHYITRNNTHWCTRAAELIYEFLSAAKNGKKPARRLGREFPEEYKIMSDLFAQNGSLENRCARWRDYTMAPLYDPHQWRRQAIRGDVKWDHLSASGFRHHAARLSGKKGFETSKWAFFHRAAFRQRALVLGWLN